MNTYQNISMTDAALKQLDKKIAEQGSGKGLRIILKKMGCSGLTYDLAIVENAEADDAIFPQGNGRFVCIPQKDLPFVIGSTIDYVREGIAGARFKFSNPHEKSTCGCGESFNV